MNIALIVAAAVVGDFGLAVLVGRFLRAGSARPHVAYAPVVADSAGPASRR